jgi:amino-acid N-acetyltransferase
MSIEADSAVDLKFEPASVADFDAVYRLLSDGGLPVADLEHHIESFTLAKCQATVVGTAGLEIYGELALLRSLCVARSHRSRGIGEALIAVASRGASARGVRALYLLTTSAASYFAALGFLPVERQHVPSPIRGTTQFSSLCPTSAVCMHKSIAPSLDSADSAG